MKIRTTYYESKMTPTQRHMIDNQQRFLKENRSAYSYAYKFCVRFTELPWIKKERSDGSFEELSKNRSMEFTIDTHLLSLVKVHQSHISVVVGYNTDVRERGPHYHAIIQSEKRIDYDVIDDSLWQYQQTKIPELKHTSNMPVYKRRFLNESRRHLDSHFNVAPPSKYRSNRRKIIKPGFGTGGMGIHLSQYRYNMEGLIYVSVKHTSYTTAPYCPMNRKSQCGGSRDHKKCVYRKTHKIA